MEFRDRNEGEQNTPNAAELISWWVSADYRRAASCRRDCYHVNCCWMHYSSRNIHWHPLRRTLNRLCETDSRMILW